MIRKFDDRQYILSALVELGVPAIGADAAAGAANAKRLVFPVGTLILRMSGFTGQAFDGTAAITIKDADTTYANAVDAKAVGAKTFTGAPKFFPNGTTMDVSLVGDSDASGVTFANIEYVIVDRGNEVYE